MSKFFVSMESVDPAENRIVITGEDVKHIKSVLRSSPGDVLEVSDGSGFDYDVKIVTIEKDSIITEITGKRLNKTEPPIHITLFQGVPKSDKLEFIIQKCVELGVHRIVPVMTARTVVKLDNQRDAQAKTMRWQRIALEAAKQCGRGIVPLVEEPVRFAEALKLAGSCDLKLLPYEEETTSGLKQCLQRYRLEKGQRESTCPEDEKCRYSAAIFIGPEGGFSAEEVKNAVASGFQSVTLGPRILRTETAGLAVIAIMMYELGDMAGEG